MSINTKKHRKRKDVITPLIGKRFYNGDKWIEVIGVGESQVTSWGLQQRCRCRCKCGKIFDAPVTDVRNNKITSCGCGRRKNDVGKVFNTARGPIEIIEMLEDYIDGGGRARKRCRCKCHCGSEFDTYVISLQAGKITSCENCRKEDIAGQTFGNDDAWIRVLYEIEPHVMPSGRSYRMYMCQCKCGTIFPTDKDSIKRGSVMSCGCLSSKGESVITNVLNNLNIPFTKQKTFDTCVNPNTGHNLRFDFNIVNSELLIEYDGIQHFYDNGRDVYNHEATVCRDNIKNNWCRENNKQLIRIPYTELPRIDAAYMLTLMRLAAMEEDEELVCPA